MAHTKKIGKKQQALYNQAQLDLLSRYFEEYNLMNHYNRWVNAIADKEKAQKIPRRLDNKIFWNPVSKFFRKISKWLKKK